MKKLQGLALAMGGLMLVMFFAGLLQFKTAEGAFLIPFGVLSIMLIIIQLCRMQNDNHPELLAITLQTYASLTLTTCVYLFILICENAHQEANQPLLWILLFLLGASAVCLGAYSYDVLMKQDPTRDPHETKIFLHLQVIWQSVIMYVTAMIMHFKIK